MSVLSATSDTTDFRTPRTTDEKSTFDRWRRFAGVVDAPVAFLTTWFLTDGVLEPKGQNMAAVLVMVAVLWITEVLPLPEAVAALVAASLLFVPPTNVRQLRFTITWEEAAKIDWETILLFGGGLSLGKMMFDTGVAEAMGRGVTGLMGASSLWTLTAVAIGMGIFLSEMTSNTSAANMVIPVVIALAQAAHVDPVPPALGACSGASYGFMLPVSVPPNAIVYGSGLVPITKMMRAGILFDLLGFFLILGSLRVLCPLLGLVH